MILLALLFPSISFFLRGKIMNGFACIFLQLTLIGWLPAAIWAVSEYNNDQNKKRILEMEKRLSQNK